MIKKRRRCKCKGDKRRSSWFVVRRMKVNSFVSCTNCDGYWLTLTKNVADVPDPLA